MSEHEHGPVVVGVDGSTSSFEALEWAVSECAGRGSKLLVVVAWEWPSSYGWAMPLPEGYRPQDDARRLADSSVARARTIDPTLDVEGITMEGNAGARLVETSHGADLLVVGSRGHRQLAGMLLGSVGKYCTGHAHCPVVVYHDRADGHDRPADIACAEMLGTRMSRRAGESDVGVHDVPFGPADAGEVGVQFHPGPPKRPSRWWRHEGRKGHGEHRAPSVRPA